MAIMKNPQAFFDTLTEKYKYILKGFGPPEFHLGGDFGCDPDGTLYWGAKSYISKMMGNYERLFGGQPKKFSATPGNQSWIKVTLRLRKISESTNHLFLQYISVSP